MSTENSEAEEPNAEEALASLAQIEKNTKRILDDDWNEDSDSSKKRTTDNATGEPSVKKPKLDGDASDKVVALKKKIKKGLGKLKRSEIEEMVATKCLELMTNKSELGKLRQQADGYEETVERWKRRAGALSKQCTDLSTVMRKYITGQPHWKDLDFNASPPRLQDEGSRQGGSCAHHALCRPPGKPLLLTCPPPNSSTSCRFLHLTRGAWPSSAPPPPPRPPERPSRAPPPSPAPRLEPPPPHHGPQPNPAPPWGDSCLAASPSLPARCVPTISSTMNT